MKNTLTVLTLLVIFASCKKAYKPPVDYPNDSITNTISVKDFTSVTVGEGITVTIKKGDFGVTSKGDKNDIADIKTNIDSENLLNIDFGTNRQHFITEVNITMPTLEYLVFNGNKVDITGFNEKHFCITANNGSDIFVNSDAETFDLLATGGSVIEIIGKCTNLIFEANGKSELLGRNLFTENTDVNLIEASKIKANVSLKLSGQASNGSFIQYYGNPKVDVFLYSKSTINKN